MTVMGNKKGSITILICLFFSSLMILITAYIGAAKATALSGTVKSLGLLWGESVLAEYDLNLYNRYGIFGFYGQPADIGGKFDFYANKSFERKKYVSYEGSTIRLYNYALIDTNVFKKQIVKCGKHTLANKDLNIKDIVSVKYEDSASSPDNLFEGLPSGGQSSGLSVLDAVGALKSMNSIKNLFKQSSDVYFENKYIESYFKNMIDDRGLGKTHFQNEEEYILCGKLTDEGNANAVRIKLIGVREALNLAYALSNEKMCAEAMAAAEILTPGPPAVATQKALLAAWALAESNNDYKLLIKGHRVPLMKNSQTWAIDLESILENREEGMIFTGVDEGESYGEYLSGFLALMDENVKLLRIMDLIQINNRAFYYGSFMLKNYSAGLEYALQVNGKKYEFTRDYETKK